MEGKKVKLLPNIMVCFTVVFISLLSPYGQILFNLGPLPLTKGAIISGIDKASLLIGLIYLSKNILNIQVKFPGYFGSLLRDTFHYFNQLTNSEKITKKNIISQIDEKLLNLKPYFPKIQELKASNDKGLKFNIITTLLTTFFFILDNIPFNT